MAKLGVNIDHVATVRQARRELEPDPIEAARICERAGCDSIVAHLREDRRHINDDDVAKLKDVVQTRFNLEMSVSERIVRIACEVRPHQATLVPEKREELTTEGGLDVLSNQKKIAEAIARLSDSGIEASLFIDPEQRQIAASKKAGAHIIEIHTGRYANAQNAADIEHECSAIEKSVKTARDLGMVVNAGHGLNYKNTARMARIKEIEELNIGHSIISRSIFVGLENAVKEMLRLVR